jgi:hypothetical protein
MGMALRQPFLLMNERGFMLEEKTQVFIMRIWIEPREVPGAQPQWRGMLEHLPSGNKHYLTNLGELPLLIAPYLRALGVEPNPGPQADE